MFMYYIKDLEFKKCKYVNVKYTFYNARVIQLHYYSSNLISQKTYPQDIVINLLTIKYLKT